jgi:carbon monoxide dehydrogenase subunit G
MKITGDATFRAPVDRVYEALVDPAVLVRTLPGCRRLEQVGDDTYQATVLAGVGSIKGTFAGEVRLTDRDAPRSFTLHASGAGGPGTVSAVARVSLADADGGGTLLRYDADATVGGVIGGVGQRMLTGVARRTADEFFTAVDRAIAEPVPAPAHTPTPAPGPAPAPAPVLAGAPSSTESVGTVPVLTPGGTTATEPKTGAVWTVPEPPADLAGQRMRDLLVGAAVGAIIALLGVVIGAIVAGW